MLLYADDCLDRSALLIDTLMFDLRWAMLYGDCVARRWRLAHGTMAAK